MEPLNRNNPEFWYWGVFYNNPADDSIWVPKRIGIGYTLNYAHRASWIISFVFLAVTVLIMVLAIVFDQ
jgi:uncharacterized membrane protein